jgi:hypothetical protein
VRKISIPIFILLIYCGGYVAVRASHNLVHLTDKYGRGGAPIIGNNAIIPGREIDNDPSMFALSCWYVFWPLHFNETKMWNIKNRYIIHNASPNQSLKGSGQ